MTQLYLNKINDYIKAKDGNKPHLMSSVFTSDAELEMQVNSDNITFPAKVLGVDNISEVLVRNFNLAYENIYTLCLIDTITINNNTLCCDWLVSMSDRSSQALRFGYGQYRWVFQHDLNESPTNNMAEKLSIRIDEMINLTNDKTPVLLPWLQALDYPWITSAKLLENLPNIDDMTAFKTMLLNMPSKDIE
jgi:hypothetical protein